MVHYIDNKTRVKLKFYLPAISLNVICLQRKRWYGWVTTSWIYPTCLSERTMEYTIEWLLWAENPGERRVADKIFNNVSNLKNDLPQR